MLIGVIALALVAVAQPALAAKNSHRHSHHTRTHHVQRSADAPPAFVRTDATDTPVFFSDPSFPNRAWSPPSTQQISSFEPARRPRSAPARDGALDAMIAHHAAANGLPVELVHRVVIRESRYNPRGRNGGNLGLMQIKHATARGVGYTGSAAGLFDAETNLTYAVRYLAGAWRAAGGNAGRAVSLYASGYHGRAVRQPAQRAVARSSDRELRSAPVALREAGLVLMRDDAVRYR